MRDARAKMLPFSLPSQSWLLKLPDMKIKIGNYYKHFDGGLTVFLSLLGTHLLFLNTSCFKNRAFKVPLDQ